MFENVFNEIIKKP